MFPTNNSSSSSDMSLSNSEGSHWMSIPNEEMQLAASTPKKRAGRKKFKETRHPIYRGVRKRNNDKWVCEMREPNKKTKIWLGTFPTVEMAARAHDVAAMALRGRYACLNFADSVWRLPKPATNETKDIQKAATEAAELFKPEKTSMINDNDNDNNMVLMINDNDNDNNMAVVSATTEEQSMLCPEEEEVEAMDMQEIWRNMALMSPTHSFEYEDNIIQDFHQDEEVSLWNF